MAWRSGALRLPDLPPYWPMVQKAAAFVILNGPRTKQDRWEENAGYTPFTLAVAVASLLAAAEIAEALDVDEAPALFRDTADAWNEQIEDWVYVKDTPLAREAGVAGYYIRIAPESPRDGRPRPPWAGPGAQPRGRDGRNSRRRARQHGRARPRAVRPARAGRSPHPRYGRGDRQGVEGRSPAGAGLAPLQFRRLWRKGGRAAVRRRRRRSGLAACWPASARITRSPRGAGTRRKRCSRPSKPRPVPAGSSPSRCGTVLRSLRRELAPGEPSGSAMPLVWAHAEYVKLLRSLADGAVFDMPPHAARRYPQGRQQARCRPWREDCPVAKIPAGMRVAPRLRGAGDRALHARRLGHAGQGRGERYGARPVRRGDSHGRNDGRPARRLHLARRRTGAWRGRNFEVAIAPAQS